MTKPSTQPDSLSIPITPEASYVLGFLWGDGRYISCGKNLSVEAVEDDLSLLESTFQSTGTWKTNRRHRPNRRPQMTLRLRVNVELDKFLVEANFPIKSTASASALLHRIPHKLHQYWYRGYFDADGSFYLSPNRYTRHSVLSAHADADLNFFLKKLDELEIRYEYKQLVNKSYRSSAVRIVSRLNILKWGKYLYQDRLDIGLKRKYEKWTASIEEYGPSTPVTLSVNGITKKRIDWAREIGVSNSCIISRLKAGWTPEQACTIIKGGKR